MPEVEDGCPNCGAEATARFCPQCGQSTNVRLPTLRELLADGLGAVFSYDAKLWCTVGTLARRPGGLTVDYLEGRRARYLTPLQLFFWLQTIAFLAHRASFSDDEAAIAAKTRALLLFGAGVALALALLYARRRMRFVVHLVAAVHVWAFLMLWLLVEYALVPPVVGLLARAGLLRGDIPEGLFITASTAAAMVVYVALALQRVYRAVWPLALIQSVGILTGFALAAHVFGRAMGLK